MKTIKKKGIEPLIATILLVVVAVILVTIVLTWGKSFTNKGLDTADQMFEDNCSAATINLSNCDYIPSTGTVTVFLRNTSSTYSFDANDFTANVIDDTDNTDADMDISLTTAALPAGATVIPTISTTVTGATRVKLQIRSNTCPSIASSEIVCS